MKANLIWSKDKSLLSVQVPTLRLPGREFPADAVLVDIERDGTILWNNTEAKQFRATLLNQLIEEEGGAI